MKSYRKGNNMIIRGLNALDIINYERNELGNNINILLPLEIICKIPSEKCIWLSDDLHYLNEFEGPLDKVEYINIIASDNYGGKLCQIS